MMLFCSSNEGRADATLLIAAAIGRVDGAITRGAEEHHAALQGLFYACKDGAEARRFNRLLIEAGMIKGL